MPLCLLGMKVRMCYRLSNFVGVLNLLSTSLLTSLKCYPIKTFESYKRRPDFNLPQKNACHTESRTSDDIASISKAQRPNPLQRKWPPANSFSPLPQSCQYPHAKSYPFDANRMERSVQLAGCPRNQYSRDVWLVEAPQDLCSVPMSVRLEDIAVVDS